MDGLEGVKEVLIEEVKNLSDDVEWINGEIHLIEKYVTNVPSEKNAVWISDALARFFRGSLIHSDDISNPVEKLVSSLQSSAGNSALSKLEIIKDDVIMGWINVIAGRFYQTIVR